MNNALKSLQNNALAALGRQAPNGVVNAIKTASAKTGVSFSYLMEKAAAESSFDPNAKAKTSSATGLFQFIESTWMDMVEKHGDKYGVDIEGASRQELLNMRKDPALASFMAAEFASDNKAHLEQTVGGKIGETELYFAHFMGAGGASAFLSQLNENPLSIGADLFPKAARANRNVFYDRQTGEPKTLQAIYDHFDKKFSGDDTTATLAHKPRSNAGGIKGGYHHMPPSLKKPIEIENNPYAMLNSLYQGRSQLDAFFGNREEENNGVPRSLYGHLSSPTAMLLQILR